MSGPLWPPNHRVDRITLQQGTINRLCILQLAESLVSPFLDAIKSDERVGSELEASWKRVRNHVRPLCNFSTACCGQNLVNYPAFASGNSSAKQAPDTVQMRFRFASDSVTPGVLIQFLVPFLWGPLGEQFKRMPPWVAQYTSVAHAPFSCTCLPGARN